MLLAAALAPSACRGQALIYTEGAVNWGSKLTCYSSVEFRNKRADQNVTMDELISELAAHSILQSDDCEDRLIVTLHPVGAVVTRFRGDERRGGGRWFIFVYGKEIGCPNIAEVIAEGISIDLEDGERFIQECDTPA